MLKINGYNYIITQGLRDDPADSHFYAMDGSGALLGKYKTYDGALRCCKRHAAKRG